MAFDRHTIFGGALVVVVAIACIAGLVITGGPGKARKEREDDARLQALSETALALACYRHAHGRIPEDLAVVDAEMSEAGSDSRARQGCRDARFRTDPLTRIPFALRRDATGEVTHICADFATDGRQERPHRFQTAHAVIPGLYDPRETAGEHCFALDLDAELD